jgi:hypothetical protein
MTTEEIIPDLMRTSAEFHRDGDDGMGRLLGRAADAIEARDRRIAELEAVAREVLEMLGPDAHAYKVGRMALEAVKRLEAP